MGYMGIIYLALLCCLSLVTVTHSGRLTSTKSSNSKKIVCYFTNWAQYRPNEGKYIPEDVQPNLCTHIIFAFGWMKKHKISSFDSTDETKNGKKGMYERVVDIKQKNSNLKVLLAVGGWSFGTQRFKDMASNRYNRQLFVFSAMKYLRDRNFDGLDLDWEFPRGGEDKKNFISLLKELREAFEEEAKDKKLPRLLLTVAVSAGSENIRSGYDVPAVAAYCDFINVMSYDFHGKWESQTGHNSPLYALSTESAWRKQLCMEFGVKLWEKMGTPKEKIIVGLATYGRSFTLSSPDKNGMNVPTRGGGKAGTYTREEGFLSYYEICDFIKKGAKYLWDEEQKVPYAFFGDQWVGFDDEKSIRKKLAWIKENGYGGAMVWTLDMDDFRGTCNGKKYPLIGAMGEVLLGHSKRPVTDLDAISKKAQAALPTTAAPRVVKEVIIIKENGEKEEEIIVEADPDETNARVTCYYTSWSLKRPGVGKFEPEHIDPFLCTHVIFAFATIKNDSIAPIDAADEGEGSKKGLYGRVLGLKEKNPNLKVLLSVGGWISGTAPFKQITKSGYRQSLFVFNSIDYLRQKGFDGLDIAWEFPRGAEDKEKFTNLVKDLREAFDGEGKASDKPRLLLSAAVPASFEAVAAGYDVTEINKYLDMLNVMTYDFHGNWERQVGHNSPLYALYSATNYQKKLTVDYSAKEWVEKGASKEKLVIGVPTYGRSFTLKNTSLTDIGAPATDGGKPGNYTGEPGVMAFFEICDMLKSGAILVWDNEQMVPYAYQDDQWVGFDDQRSLKIKVQWLKEAGYGGVMIWSIDMDDFRGTCMGLKYPLINTIKDELKGYKVANLEVQSSNLLQLFDKDEVLCEEEDGHISYHKDKKECTKYYMCEGKRRHHMPCPANLVFNPDENVCDWPENVADCSNISG